jgi:glutaredoxin-like protein NrdH
MVEKTVVEGKNKKHSVILYALSTCFWCKKTRELLGGLGVQYSFVYVDELSGREEEEAMEEVKKINPDCSFPTALIDGKAVCGFDEEKIRKALS